MARRSFDDPHGNSDAARQALLDNRCEHKSKRHRTKPRVKARSKKHKRKTRHNAAVARKEWMRRKSQAIRYWARGDVDHP